MLYAVVQPLNQNTGGSAPLGYDVDSETKLLKINLYESEAVKLIFSMYADGSGYSEIIYALNINGFKTKKGNHFCKNSLNSILHNEKYNGTFVFNKTEQKSFGKRNSNKHKPENEIIRIKNGCPAIIDNYLWERVRLKMTQNKKAQASYKGKKRYLLSGKLICKKCGSSFVGNSALNKSKETLYRYYECNYKKRTHQCNVKNIGADFIESAAISALYDDLFAPDVISKAVDLIFKYAQNEKKVIPVDISASQSELKIIKKQISNIVNAVTNGLYHESMKEQLTTLENKKAYYENIIDEASSRKQKCSVSKEEILNFLKQFENIKTDPYSKQKKAVDIFIDKIIIGEDDLFIDILSPYSNKKKINIPDDNIKDTFGICGVEARGIEPLSENSSTQTSTGLAFYLRFLSCYAKKQA